MVQHTSGCSSCVDSVSTVSVIKAKCDMLHIRKMLISFRERY